METLKSSELRYRRLFEEAQDGILILDAETGMIQDVNPYLIKMLGYSREELIEKKLWEVGAFKDVGASQDAFEALKQNEYIRYENLPLKAKNGRLIQVEFISNVYFVGFEKVIQCNIRDITEHKRIIGVLKESEKKYHDFVNQSPDGIFIMELSGRILTVNKAMCTVLEFSEEEFLTMSIWDIIPEEYLEGYKQRLTKILAGESFEEMAEYAVRGKSGKVHYVEVLSAPHYSGTHIIGFQGIVRDITKRRDAETALRESDERFRAVLNSAPITIFATDDKGIFTLHEGKGMQRAEMKPTGNVGESAFKLYSSLLILEPDGQVSTGEKVISRVLGGETVVGIIEMAGEWFENKFAPLLDTQRMVVGIVGVATDITARKQAELALHESEKRFRALVENNSGAITLLNVSGIAIYDSPAAAGMLGYAAKDWIGQNVFELVHPDDATEIQSLFQQLVETPRARLENTFRVRHKSGSWLWIEMVTTNLLAEPSVNAVVLNYRDITGSKQAEEEIRQRLSELEVLYQSGLAFSQLIDPKSIAEKIIDLLEREMDWHHTAVRLYHPESTTVELLAFNIPNLNTQTAHNAAQERLNIMQRPDQGLSGWAIRHGQPVRSNDLKNDPRYLETFPGLQSGLYVPIKISGQVLGVISIESERPQAFTESDERLAMTLAGQAAIAIENATLLDSLQRSNSELSMAYDATIEGWSRALDLRDKETEGHSLRVTAMTLKLARAFGLSEDELAQVRWGALLHDIGKMGVPDGILLKPGALTDTEWVAMKKHPTFAYEMLFPIQYLRGALDIPYCHHEKWDGTGYPRGLKDSEIPLVARIFSVVDVWDALSSDRPYRSAWSEEKVRNHIHSLSGTHFDPHVVDIFMDVIK